MLSQVKSRSLNEKTIIIFLMSLVFLFSSLVNVQDKTIPNSPQATGDKVIIKDESGNALIEINDEGTFGSITLPDSAGAPGTVTNKLYNVSGTLNFNGTALGAGGASSINNLSDGKTGGESVFLGAGAGTNDDGTTNANTAIGLNALFSNTSGNNNKAIGYASLFFNTTGSNNIAIGSNALYNNTTKPYLVAIGDSSLFNNGIGADPNPTNMQGLYNTAIGSKTLFSNTIGWSNIATGYQALYSNKDGQANIAIGYNALYSKL